MPYNWRKHLRGGKRGYNKNRGGRGGSRGRGRGFSGQSGYNNTIDSQNPYLNKDPFQFSNNNQQYQNNTFKDLKQKLISIDNQPWGYYKDLKYTTWKSISP